MTESVGPITRKVVAAFDLVAPETDHPEDAIWGSVVRDLPGDHARLLPRAFADALPVIAALLPEDRLILAVRLVVGLDIIECVGSLAYLAESRQNADCAIGAAALAANPAVAQAFLERVGSLRTAVNMSPIQQRAFDVMLGTLLIAEAESNDALAPLEKNRWPGRSSAAAEGSLILVEHNDAAPAAAMWLLLGELYASGALLRRSFADLERPVPEGMIDRGHVSVGWGDRSIMLGSDNPHVRVPAELFEPNLMYGALEQIASAVRSAQDAELDLSGSPRFVADREPDTPAGSTAAATLAIRRQIRLIRQSAYEAVLSFVADEMSQNSVQFALLMELGENSTSEDSKQFATVISEGFTTQSDNELTRAASDGVRAAVSELIRQKRLRFDPKSPSAVLQRVP